MECDPFAAPPPVAGATTQMASMQGKRATGALAAGRLRDRTGPQECEVVNFTPISRNAIEASRCPVCPGQWPFSARYFCAADFVPFEAFGRRKLKSFLPSRGAIHA